MKILVTGGSRRVAQGAAVLIAPSAPLPIARVSHDPGAMQRVYDLGREAAEACDLAALQ